MKKVFRDGLGIMRNYSFFDSKGCQEAIGGLCSGMSIIAEDSSVMAKTRELCETIISDQEFTSLQEKMENFYGNEEASLQFQSLQELGDGLNQKQQAGVQLGEAEIKEFDDRKSELFKNAVVTDFLQAQQEIQVLQQSVSKYIGLTLELGRVPTEEDFAEASQGGGCCGGGGGGGCNSGGCGC